jgi:hypothetical protein
MCRRTTKIIQEIGTDSEKMGTKFENNDKLTILPMKQASLLLSQCSHNTSKYKNQINLDNMLLEELA